MKMIDLVRHARETIGAYVKKYIIQENLLILRYDAVVAAMHDAVWLDANRYYEAERAVLDQKRPNPGHSLSSKPLPELSHSSIAREIAFARQKIQNFLKSAEAASDTSSCTLVSRLERVENELATYRRELAQLYSSVEDVSGKIASFEAVMKRFLDSTPNAPGKQIKCKAPDSKGNIQNGSSSGADADDDLDLFGSDDEVDEAAEKLKEERLRAYVNKKAKKPALVAKSSVVLDVKPWDDETDMKQVETCVRGIQIDGLKWGASKLVPLAYGINKLQIIAIVEDEKVSIDWLQETISDIEDLVQSVDIAAFNKL